MKELAAGAAVAIAVFGTVPYLIGTLRGQISPHAFTWLIWSVTTLIAFVGQLVGGGGIGAAAAGASACVGVAISGYAFWRGDRFYTRLDWLCLAGASVALMAWAFTGGPLTALILIGLVDATGAVPTIRKAFVKPHEEGISPFILANVKWLLAICALDHLNALTLLFPATTTAVNTAIISVVLVRRERLQARGGTATSAGGEDGCDSEFLATFWRPRPPDLA
jgi:hypothetical protein